MLDTNKRKEAQQKYLMENTGIVVISKYTKQKADKKTARIYLKSVLFFLLPVYR